MSFFDFENPSAFTRRTFMTRGLVLASAATTVPYFVQRSAAALLPADFRLSSTPGMPEDHVLVVVQLGGGNDGLNTVIPFHDPAYYRARPAIGIPENKVLKLGKDAHIGLHPQLTGLKDLYDAGMLSVVQGVGYPNPNRSHFKSMDIWQTADTTATGNGWLGRYFDNDCCGFDSSGKPTPEPLAGIAIGKEAPLAMQGQISKPIGFESSELFQWLGKGVDPKLMTAYNEINNRGASDGVDSDSNAGFLMRTAMDAQIASDQIRKAVAQRPLVSYPNSDLSRQLQMVASMIRAGLKTRVYYVTLGGFDTHAGQGGENGRQAQLLQQVGSSIKAFYEDLKKQGNDSRVLTISFSEFGRRVQQNASGGTDHGAAAPMFVIGPMVRPGVVGNHPSLTDLDAGDLKFGIDFRSVYAGVLEGWLKADSKKVLEAAFRPVQIVKTT
ncbi:MAG TPA: DUF1501 domain-containing protein [Phycisphaerales bacterium]|jgi:uncharacterized protein (DUF1501 family)|nr:DUF1501 domain-containing protein [Phycisphaerales bacterium]